jgi:hypothetical protein
MARLHERGDRKRPARRRGNLGLILVTNDVKCWGLT